MSSKFNIASLTITLASSWLVGIGGLSPVTAEETSNQLRVMVTAGPEEDLLAKYAKSDFEKQSGIHVTIETVSRDLWPARAAREFTADQAEYDLVALNPSAGDPCWAARGNSVDLRTLLPPSVVANILPKLRDAMIYNDKLVAVPQYWNTEMYFYRKDLFADAANQAKFKAKYGYDLAPPQTWDQVVDIDEFFYRPPALYGGWMSGVNWGTSLDYQVILFGVGGRAFDLQANALLANSPESVKAFQIMQRIAKTAPPSFKTGTFFDADTMMKNGKLATYTNFSYIWPELEKQPSKYAMTVLPGKGVLIGTFAFAVPKSSRNQQSAVKFLEWMLSDEFQAKQAGETGNPPATITQMNNPKVKSVIPSFDQFVAAAEKLTPVEVTWGPEFFEGVSQAGAEVYAGTKTAQQAADWLQNEKFKGRKPIE
jgi:multiple sugar transport system substrate-binding protein